MDWEKQDNEIWDLMKSTDFLPDGENWNEQEGWKKLLQKKQPAQRKRIPVWVRLAAAACAVGVFGGGFWYIQSTNSFTKSGKEFAHKGSNQSMELAKNSNRIKLISESENLPARAQDSNKVVHANPEYGITGSENFIKRQTVRQAGGKAGLNGQLNKDSIENTEKGLVVELPAIKTGTKIEVVDPVLPGELIPQTIVLVPVPAVKNKPRVVHYNQLSGAQSTAPPVFVQTKKEPNEWESIGWQASNTRKEPSLQLIIEISPAPKKSL